MTGVKHYHQPAIVFAKAGGSAFGADVIFGYEVAVGAGFLTHLIPVLYAYSFGVSGFFSTLF